MTFFDKMVFTYGNQFFTSFQMSIFTPGFPELQDHQVLWEWNVSYPKFSQHIPCFQITKTYLLTFLRHIPGLARMGQPLHTVFFRIPVGDQDFRVQVSNQQERENPGQELADPLVRSVPGLYFPVTNDIRTLKQARRYHVNTFLRGPRRINAKTRDICQCEQEEAHSTFPETALVKWFANGEKSEKCAN
jgi:hypothetical protein